MVGTLVIIHGNVLHKSEANRSQNSRYIYTFHVIEGQAQYDEKNWSDPVSTYTYINSRLQPTEKGFTRVYS